MRKVFEFSDPRQRRVYERLLLLGGGPAAFFRDACRLMSSEDPLESTTHVVSHLLREIESALRTVLLPDFEKGGKESQKRQVNEIAKAYGLPEDDPLLAFWIILGDRSGEWALHKQAHRDALTEPRELDEGFREFWSQTVGFLDSVLDIFQRSFLNNFHRLDKLLAIENPTDDDADVVQNKVANNLVTYKYFFSKLTSPKWLSPLRLCNIFKNGMGPQYEYLARMALMEPKLVHEISRELPDLTNPWIHADIVRLARNLPADLCVDIVPKIVEWLREGQDAHIINSEEYGELIVKLLDGGRIELALEVLRTLLRILPTDNGSMIKGLLSQYDYNEIVMKYVPRAIERCGVIALAALCDLLDAATMAAMPDQALAQASTTWRSAIEEHSQNFTEDIRASLLAGVRDAAVNIAARSAVEFGNVIELLKSRKKAIYRRVVLHLYRVIPTAPVSEILALLRDEKLFDDDCWHERTLLFRDAYLRFGSDEQNEIFRRIDVGPTDVQEFESYFQRRFEKQPSPSDIELYVTQWKVDRAAPIQAHLHAEAKAKFDSWTKLVGPPKHPEFRFYHSTEWAQRHSPLKSAEIQNLADDALIEMLLKWESRPEAAEYGTEGFADELSAAVTSDPAKYSRIAMRFAPTSLTFIRHVLMGLNEALKKGIVIDWQETLKLCHRAAELSKNLVANEHPNLSHHRTWMKSIILDLVRTGIEDGAGPAEASTDHRKEIFALIEKFIDDPDPDRDRDEERTDPMQRSLNCVRGKAMHALIRYTVWVRRKTEGKDFPKIVSGFDKTPEVRSILTARLRPENESSTAIRAVYGSSLTLLTVLDESWVKANVEMLFAGAPARLRRATRNAHFAWDRLSKQCFEILRGEYQYAVSNLEVAQHKRCYNDPESALAAKIALLFWHGIIDLDDPLLTEFFAKAPVELRACALEALGQFLDEDGELSEEKLTRLKALWESRLKSAATDATGKSGAEFHGCGYWVASRKIGAEWELEQLAAIIRLQGVVKPDHVVVDYLKDQSAAAPLKTVTCLSLLVDSDRENWTVMSWIDSARSILKNALNSDDSAANQAATVLINRLASRGYLQFKDLLP